jgi:hypothetical protein
MDEFPTWALKEGRNSNPNVTTSYLMILTCGAFGYDASNVEVVLFKQLISLKPSECLVVGASKWDSMYIFSRD